MLLWHLNRTREEGVGQSIGDHVDWGSALTRQSGSRTALRPLHVGHPARMALEGDRSQVDAEGVLSRFAFLLILLDCGVTAHSTLHSLIDIIT